MRLQRNQGVIVTRVTSLQKIETRTEEPYNCWLDTVSLLQQQELVVVGAVVSETTKQHHQRFLGRKFPPPFLALGLNR